MELGLSLGDSSKPFGFLKQKQPPPPPHKTNINKTAGLDFCMALGLNPSSPIVNEEHLKIQKSHEEEDEEEDDDDDNQSSDDNEVEAPLIQLNLLPLAPAIPRRILPHLQSLHPWSSDNGSSENGSSGNMGLPAVKGLDVNRIPGSTAAAAAEEVSSANSPFHCMYRNSGNGNLNKRDFEATGNDVVEGVRASDDDDENGVNARKKLRLSKEQSAFLEESFKEHNTLNPKQKQALAKQLNLRPRQVEVWFQNRRARTKLKQTEVDCEYLKRCCEKLSEENRRLQKELQDLRALKASNPYYMQLPATTLTMCPSCERVATTTAAAPATGKTNSTPFPLTRPKFYPFSQTQKHPNQPAAS